MRLKKIIKEFEKGNVCVVGLRGCGKDMLFANVIARRKQAYVSNTNYHCDKSPYIKLDFDKLNVKNTYKNFIDEDIIPYDYPYPEFCDVYVADCGIYLPAQYCNELDKLYKTLPTYFALSRHLANANFHINVQNLERIWNKAREMSDIYIKCESCHVFKFKLPLLRRLNGLVIQKVTLYDKYQSCVDRVQPYVRARAGLFASKEEKAQIRRLNEEALRRYKENYGKVKTRLLIYRNKSNYDTRLFKGVLSGEK